LPPPSKKEIQLMSGFFSGQTTSRDISPFTKCQKHFQLYTRCSWGKYSHMSKLCWKRTYSLSHMTWKIQIPEVHMIGKDTCKIYSKSPNENHNMDFLNCRIWISSCS
jgi:hypothetical protein